MDTDKTLSNTQKNLQKILQRIHQTDLKQKRLERELTFLEKKKYNKKLYAAGKLLAQVNCLDDINTDIILGFLYAYKHDMVKNETLIFYEKLGKQIRKDK